MKYALLLSLLITSCKVYVYVYPEKKEKEYPTRTVTDNMPNVDVTPYFTNNLYAKLLQLDSVCKTGNDTSLNGGYITMSAQNLHIVTAEMTPEFYHFAPPTMDINKLTDTIKTK